MKVMGYYFDRNKALLLNRPSEIEDFVKLPFFSATVKFGLPPVCLLSDIPPESGSRETHEV